MQTLSFVKSMVEEKRKLFVWQWLLVVIIQVSLNLLEQRVVTYCHVINGEWLLWIFFYFIFFTITLFKAIHGAARAPCSDLDAHVKKEVWQLFCVLIWERQRSVFSGRLLAAELQRREIFVLTDSLFSRVYGLSHMFYRLFYGPLSIRKGMNQWKTHMRCRLEKHIQGKIPS